MNFHTRSLLAVGLHPFALLPIPSITKFVFVNLSNVVMHHFSLLCFSFSKSLVFLSIALRGFLAILLYETIIIIIIII